MFFILQALRLFRLASELETRAARLCFEALQHLTVAVAGVDCRELFTLLTTFFGQGTAFAEDPFAFLDGAPKVQDPLDLTDTDSDDDQAGGDPGSQVPASTSTTTGTPAVPPVASAAPKAKPKAKVQYQDKVNDIAQARGFLPVDAATIHNTGIPTSHHVKRSGSSERGRSLYVCSYASECSAVPYSGDIASATSHVHKHHLGHCVVCPYCGARYYNSNGWRDHMGAKHAQMPWYGTQVSSLAKVWSEGFPSSATTSEVTITVPPPTSTDVVEDVPEEATDIITEEGDGSPEETEETAQDPPTGVPVSGIDRFTIEELRGFMEFLPSDL